MSISKPKQSWYAIYVRTRAEKKVHAALLEDSIEAFLPLQKKMRQWKDRRKLVDMPLINGYIFVHITSKDHDKVLQHNNVVCYVRFNGRAAIISPKDIDLLKRMTGQSEYDVETTIEQLKPGQKVEVIAGPLCGIKGEMIAYRGKNKIALRIPPLGYTILIDAPQKTVVPINGKKETKQLQMVE